ncbi:MAG: DUF5665 domain-containing protein [Patescibacteria group bacterium]
MSKVVKKVHKKVKQENELGARRAVLEDLFYDFNASRAQIYKMNFFRGIFFGVGTVIGGTLVVALVVWMLSWLTDIPGGFGDFIQYIVDTVEQST